jgi:cell division protein FtsI (penicillin-binding protein 3)
MTAVPIGKWTRARIGLCGVVFLALFIAVGRRAYQLQIGPEATRLRGLAEEQHNRDIEMPPRRGRILDRNGAELASTADVDSIYCNPRMLGDVGSASLRLANALGLDRSELSQRLGQKRYFAWVKRKVTPQEVEAVRALGLPGMAFVREPRRFYPNRMLAATVMGHSGTDGRGLDGVELAMDKALRGQSASVQGVRDALGRQLFVDGMGDAGNGVGNDVVLTIDRYLTFVTERALAAAQERHHARSVIAVMMDPRTGELLAMASVPSYNPNDPGGASENGARNRAITDAFEPGSTMKTFTIAAALDAGAVRPDDRFDCQMGRMSVGKYTIHDTHPHGVLTVSEVYKLSSNIGATKIARRLGKEKLASALLRFGFGHTTALGLPGERTGVVRPLDRWGEIGFANVSFGQGMTATPMQIVHAMSAIANGGILVPPRIVARIRHVDGTVEEAPAPATERVISEAAARAMTTIMEGVTQTGGTARAAAIDGYSVAGKTGTAQKVTGGHYDSSKWVSSFIGFAPAHAPRIALIVLVDEPQGVHLGGAVAAPIFKEIAEQALRYLHVSPSPEWLARKSPEFPAASTPSGSATGRAAKTPRPQSDPTDDDVDERLGSDVALTTGDDDAAADPRDREAEVVTVGPVARNAASDAVDDDTDEASASSDDGVDGEPGGQGGGEGKGEGQGEGEGTLALPDFRGMTVAAVLEVARHTGVSLSFDDASSTTGVAVAQTPAPGPAPRGVVCRLAFGGAP